MLSLFPVLLIAPILFMAAATQFRSTSGPRPTDALKIAEWTALASLALALLGALQVIVAGQATLTIGWGLLEFSFTANAISATMGILVAFIGWVVVRYARTYLDGEPREGLFHQWLLTAIAMVIVFVMSGSLIIAALSLAGLGYAIRRLLLFYPKRAEARRAAKKFAIVWGAGDGALIVAAILFWFAFGTTNIADINTAASQGMTALSQAAIGFVVLAALLKTAAFPLHGWLTEVMEAPTPVSALLHAGVINAGGYLLIKLSETLLHSPGAMAALVLIGGLTAVFGAVVMLTQSAVKTALAWSTVSQMGFMLLQVGLGLWALALLHIVAHGLYKAYAFLSSGDAVQQVLSVRRPGPVATPSVQDVAKSFAIAISLYAVIAIGISLLLGPKPVQAIALGAILIFGTAYLVAQGLAGAAPRALNLRTGGAALGAAIAYFTFQEIAARLWGPHLAAPPEPGALEWALIVLAVLSFGLVAFAQTLFPLWAHHPASAGLRVHVANGLYLNALFDRILGGFRHRKSV